MNIRARTSPVEWFDPVVEALHELRTQLLEKYQGNLHTYSEAARARALAPQRRAIEVASLMRRMSGWNI